MSWVVDGSNLLGTSRADATAKRRLVQALARFARARRTRVVCTFDGVEPEHFGRHLGGVSVVFSGARAADELIAARVAEGGGWKVVTSDRGLAGRVRRRGGGGRGAGGVRPRAGERADVRGGAGHGRGLGVVFRRSEKSKHVLMSACRH